MTDQTPSASQAIAEAQLDIQVDAMKAELTKLGGNDSITTEAAPIGEGAVDIARIEYIPLYNTRDGNKSYVLPSMLRGKLGLVWRVEHQVDPRLVGKPVWLTTPVEQAEHENLKCYLHPDSEHRARANELGIGHVCPRTGIPNTFALLQHMQVKHAKIFETFEKANDRALEAEARAEQKAYLQAMQTVVGASNAIDPETIAAIVAAVRASDKD